MLEFPDVVFRNGAQHLLSGDSYDDVGVKTSKMISEYYIWKSGLLEFPDIQKWCAAPFDPPITLY